jgi:hypothetical protein
VKEIPLSQGKVALVDDEDYERVVCFNWCASKARDTYYAVRGVRVNGKKRLQLMHRLLLRLVPGDTRQGDHRNGNGLDNRRSCNLRIGTHSQNQHNKSKTSRNTSGFKRVSYSKERRKWEVQIGINGKAIHLGRFPSAETAFNAYVEAAQKYHGEFANVK